jgi:hypothetical protein
MPAALQDVAYNQRAGFFDFIPHIMTGLIRELISWHISDVAAPLWAVFASRHEAVSVGRVASAAVGCTRASANAVSQPMLPLSLPGADMKIG